MLCCACRHLFQQPYGVVVLRRCPLVWITPLRGLYGAFIIDPREPEKLEPKADLEYVIQLQEWLVREGLTYPAMLMEGALPNYFTIHPMHVHGGPFTVVDRDGVTLSPATRYEADTINLGAGQRYDVIWPARRPGRWLIHCHIPHHTENDNLEDHGGGGLMMVIDVDQK